MQLNKMHHRQKNQTMKKLAIKEVMMKAMKSRILMRVNHLLLLYLAYGTNPVPQGEPQKLMMMIKMKSTKSKPKIVH